MFVIAEIAPLFPFISAATWGRWRQTADASHCFCLRSLWQPTPRSPLPPPNPLRHKSKQRTKCRERLGLTSRENWKARQGKPKNKTKKTTTSSSNLQVYPTRDGEKKNNYFQQARGGALCLDQYKATERQFERCLAPRLSLPPTPWPAIKLGCLEPVNWVFLTIVVFDQCNDKQTSWK